jgi:hypothetical protein
MRSKLHENKIAVHGFANTVRENSAMATLFPTVGFKRSNFQRNQIQVEVHEDTRHSQPKKSGRESRKHPRRTIRWVLLLLSYQSLPKICHST